MLLHKNVSIIAGGDIPKYRFFKIESESNGTLTVIVTTAETEVAIGVTMEAVEDGEVLGKFHLLGTGGIIPVEFAETITVGEYICAAADGKAKDWDAGTWIKHGLCVGIKDGNEIGYMLDKGDYSAHA